MIKRIISGCQTGVDQGALYAAQYLGIETGGFAPQGWMTEDGPMPELMQGFGLVECHRPGYAARTEANVQAADATLIISPEKKLTGGSYMTACCCESFEKPMLIVDWKSLNKDQLLKKWLAGTAWEVLNVAGPRESKWPGAQSLVMDWLIRALEGVS